MHYASDNTGPVHPKIMEALVRANKGYAPPYGADPWHQEMLQKIRETFEAPEAAVHLVATGTAANALLLASHVTPWQTVFCSDVAHINFDELNAPEFFCGGAKLTPVRTENGKMVSTALKEMIDVGLLCDLHGPECGPLSITQVTEVGTVHSLDEIKVLTDLAHDAGVKTHMDGARFSNAVAALGCSAAEMSWRAGIDMVSFGGTKNGLMGVEAAIIFDPARSREFELRRKRGAHLFSKHRYLAAQMAGYLTDGLWLEMAQKANAACAALVDVIEAVPGAEFANVPEANMIFARLPRHLHQKMQAAGVQYQLISGAVDGPDPEELLLGRFVTDWSSSDADRDRFAGVLGV